MGSTIELWIDQLLEITQLDGTLILLITIPLAIIQGFLGVFPFATLIVLHISAVGLALGLVFSWLTGTLSALIVFLGCRFFFSKPFNRRWGARLQKYEKWQNYMDKYGIWTIIFLRTLPIMPNNLISFMSAISQIKLRSYIWSSILGNLSHIWLFGLISSSIIMPETDVSFLLITYIIFCLTLTGIFVAKLKLGKASKRGGF
ncbi:TVP38/TMEM64 family protein [Paenibacillus eucommiae]|uniref:TVP38/TMEM64 family membrane protein n=1 Tax=Paenibacillus eucommiae TaxID=1355755 RepID=A0ABS4JBU1_9BACL|nr:VTT domain-containing protein [Paenibacillus eucommiae]MBP1996551.1 putative membrane protein YdjX (TVP38/TMEM64 family) [Paenibacillus eucommiae]